MSYTNPFLLQQGPRPDPPPFSWQPTPILPPNHPGNFIFFEIPATYAPVPQVPAQFLHYQASYPAQNTSSSQHQALTQQPVVQARPPAGIQQTQVQITPELLDYLHQQGYTIVRHPPQPARPVASTQPQTASASSLVNQLPKQGATRPTMPPPSIPNAQPWTPQHHFLDMLRKNNKPQPFPNPSKLSTQFQLAPPRPLPYHLRGPPLPRQRRPKRVPIDSKPTTTAFLHEALSIAPTAKLASNPAPHSIPQSIPDNALPISAQTAPRLEPAQSVDTANHSVSTDDNAVRPDPIIDQLKPSCAQSLEHLANALRIDSWFPQACAPSVSSNKQKEGPESSASTAVRPYIHGSRNVPRSAQQPIGTAGTLHPLPLPVQPVGFIDPQNQQQSSLLDQSHVHLASSLPQQPLVSQIRPLEPKQRAQPANRTPTERDRRNAAQRRYYEKRKLAAGKGAVRKIQMLTEEQKRARQAAIGRAWRTRNYVKVLAVVNPNEATSQPLMPLTISQPSDAAATRPNIESRKPTSSRGRGRPRLILTEEEKKARQAATCRAWRARNYVKCVGQFSSAVGSSTERPLMRTLLNIKTEPADEEAQSVNQQIRMGILIRRNIKREPMDEPSIADEPMINEASESASSIIEPTCETTIPCSSDADLTEKIEAQQLELVHPSSPAREKDANSAEIIESANRPSRASSAYSDEM